MTPRSVALGFLGAACICGYTYFNDGVLRQTMFVGNYMPTSVYGGLVLVLLGVNPLLRRLWRRSGCRWGWLAPLSGRELAVVVALSLPACCVPYSSLLRILPKAAMLPHHYARTQVGWSWKDADGTRRNVLDYAPPRLLADPSVDDGDALTGFVQGLRLGGEPIGLGDVPWAAWTRTLLFWLPLFGVLWITLAGLALVLHQQWSRHEHLPYPLVQFTRAMLPDEDGALSPMCRHRGFWIALILVLMVHLNNNLLGYFPDLIIPVRRSFNFWPLAKLFPTFMQGGGGALINPNFYFSAVGIAYLLATDVSLSVGLGPFLSKWLGGILTGYGLSLTAGTYLSPRLEQGLVFGGYLGFFGGMLYTGRRFYGQVLRRALGQGGGDEVSRGSVWGMRAFLAGFVVLVVDIALLGLDWQLALLYAGLAVIVFAVMGRVMAETGLFFIAPYLYPCVFILGILGEQSLGPQALMILFLLTCMVMIDPRETFMPYMINTVQLIDASRLHLGRTTALSLLAVFIGLGVAVPVTLYFAYDRGVNWGDAFACTSVPTYAAEGALRARTRLLAQGTLAHAESVRGWERFAGIKPTRSFVIATAIAVVAVTLCTAGRLRFARWPLHPVLFLVWSGYAGYTMAWSFLAGCLIKTLVTRYGGVRYYQALKPAMFGLIAGDVLAGLLILGGGLAYHLATGLPPKTYWVLPP